MRPSRSGASPEQHTARVQAGGRLSCPGVPGWACDPHSAAWLDLRSSAADGSPHVCWCSRAFTGASARESLLPRPGLWHSGQRVVPTESVTLQVTAGQWSQEAGVWLAGNHARRQGLLPPGLRVLVNFPQTCAGGCVRWPSCLLLSCFFFLFLPYMFLL